MLSQCHTVGILKKYPVSMNNTNQPIEFNDDGSTSLNFPEFGKGEYHGMSEIDHARMRGFKNARSYEKDTLALMLDSKSLPDIYEALGAIGVAKLKNFLPKVYNLALYDEDAGVKTEAICTIYDIGGKKSRQMLQSLRTNEFRELIDELMGK